MARCTPASTSAKGGSDQKQAATSSGGELTDEQIDRIARRVVQMMSDQVVRTIAWEVIPELAETVVKEREGWKDLYRACRGWWQRT